MTLKIGCVSVNCKNNYSCSSCGDGLLIALLALQTFAVIFFCCFHRTIFSVPDPCETVRSEVLGGDIRCNLVQANDLSGSDDVVNVKREIRKIEGTPIHGITVGPLFTECTEYYINIRCLYVINDPFTPSNIY